MVGSDDIVKMVEERWIAVTPGYPCTCGHEHHGRQLYRNEVMSSLAPQYGFCDDETCDCKTLKIVELVSP